MGKAARNKAEKQKRRAARKKKQEQSSKQAAPSKVKSVMMARPPFTFDVKTNAALVEPYRDKLLHFAASLFFPDDSVFKNTPANTDTPAGMFLAEEDTTGLSDDQMALFKYINQEFEQPHRWNGITGLCRMAQSLTLIEYGNNGSDGGVELSDDEVLEVIDRVVSKKFITPAGVEMTSPYDKLSAAEKQHLRVFTHLDSTAMHIIFYIRMVLSSSLGVEEDQYPFMAELHMAAEQRRKPGIPERLHPRTVYPEADINNNYALSQALNATILYMSYPPFNDILNDAGIVSHLQ